MSAEGLRPDAGAFSLMPYFNVLLGKIKKQRHCLLNSINSHLDQPKRAVTERLKAAPGSCVLSGSQEANKRAAC